MFDNEQREELKSMEQRILERLGRMETDMLRQFEERIAALERKKFENGK
jgi:hypothetical protein